MRIDASVSLLAALCSAAQALANTASLSSRGISKDPSCPDGWFCEQKGCDLTCAAGDVCVSFEGTASCAPAGKKWCSFNPNTFEAVQCGTDGVCCHGNCYKPGTVCCDDGTIHCTIGDLCLARPSGDNCKAGTSTSTRVSPSSSSAPPNQQPQPTIASSSTAVLSTPAVTTKASSATPSPQTSARATTTTTAAAAKPTILQQDGDFRYSGCFADGATPVLVVDHSSDPSQNGMTAEKCIALAVRKGLRYAGVESGSECFLGNTLHGSDKKSDSDCNKICAGTPTEYCGQANRLQVYENQKWSDPTLDELTNALTVYNRTLFQLSQLNNQYQSLIQRWADTQNAGKKRARFFSKRAQTITVTELRRGLTDIERQYPTLRQALAQASSNGGTLFVHAASLDVVRHGNPFVDPPNLQRAQNAFDIPLEPLERVQSAIEADIRSIDSTPSTTPLLDTAGDLAFVGSAGTAIGILAGSTLEKIALGQGVFALLALVFLSLHPSTTPGNPTTAPHSIPASATTTIASSTSSAAPSATPYFLVAANGVLSGQFKAFTEELNEKVESKVINNRFGIARVVELTTSQLKRARESRLVFSATLNNNARVIDSLTFKQSNASNGLQAPKLSKRADPQRGTAVPGSYSKGMNLNGHSGNPPYNLAHLQSLSRAWFPQGIDNLHHYNYETDPGDGTFIYIAEPADFTHPEFAQVRQERITINSPTSDPAKLDREHGTAVASMATGYSLGVAPSATVISVDMSHEEADMFEALFEVYEDILRKGRQGKAVVNMSWGMRADPGTKRCLPEFWLAKVIEQLHEEGVVVAVSGGNNGEDPVDPTFTTHAPRCYGTFMNDLIVVGSVDRTGKRSAFSGKCDAANTTPNCMSAYAVGQDVLAADSTTGRGTVVSGTSFATPIISGLAAYLLTHSSSSIHQRIFGFGRDKVAEGVEEVITDWSWSRMPTGGVDWPNVAWNGVIE
ncbi:hypothetical protein VHEMI02223 [[Torrubiella] hemipterigena]|uniref:WSC domain-containing protein n=1 Tax=[Torrubiella] hemipterigena TaxID=1531966 RepID=A0A0A1SP41_9HYPO|nr:hypothetical protein VHEMI02223 [[Torrubiella] hemipterigena]